MKKSLGFLSLLLIVVLFAAIAVTSASAAEDGGVDGGEIVTPVDPNPVDTDPPVTGGDPVDPDNSGYSDEPVDPDNSGYSDEPVDPDNSGYSDEPVDGGDPDTSWYDDDPIWYGDASNYDYNTGDNNQAAGSVSDSTNLFDTSASDNADVVPNAWTNITLDESSAKSKSGSASFSSIKTNTASSDNGQWILYLGYGLVALSVLGIMYFIVATVSARQQNRRELRHNTGAGASDAYTKLDQSADSKNASAKKPTGSRSSGQHGAGRYGDGFDSGYSSRRSSKADTGEVYVPRRAK